ncbi:nucleotidyltransferase family protein [Bacteroides sp. 51]|uniref:nucleotidyltransferase family protein n=1 Tax=Bacteroides sp. 51 TaxID=2302938 RepID=UPI0013D096E7|nr:nucleotidyltransferase family protein [Bacteroides sp. 51]NDV84100.1 DNA polymerase subunit beta [Bacteroides sp. 51]
MRSTNEYIELLKQFKEKHSSQYGIKRLGIFGSVARGEQTEDSDVDICVELDSPSLFKLVHLKEDLQNLFNTKVDIVRLRDTMDSFLRGRIEKEGLYV